MSISFEDPCATTWDYESWIHSRVANKVGISNEQTPVQFIREAIYNQ